MRFVPIKSVQQQADLSLHRVRQGFVAERTATLNRVRGLMAEFGYVLPHGPEQLRRQVPPLLEQLPTRVVGCMRDLLEDAEPLRSKGLEYEREIRISVRDNELARRARLNGEVLRVKLRGRPEVPNKRRGRTLSSHARGA